MNATRLAAASGRGSHIASGHDGKISQGAYRVSPVTLIAKHQWRTLAPYLRPTGRAQVVGQGSSQDYLSVTSYLCDFPTGDDLAVITPIYTPQQYDDYFLPIDGSTVPFGSTATHTDVQNLDISPGNTAAIGVIGKSGRRLPFLNQLVPGKGIKPTPYGLYDYKVPPSDSIYVSTPPQGVNAPGSIAPKPGFKDRVVNRPLITVYARDGLTWDTEDADGFTPMKVKVGTGLSFGPPDPLDDNRRPLQTSGGGGSGAAIWPGPGIEIDPPSAPPIAGVVVLPGVGLIDDGDHKYALTATTADAESTLNEPVTASNTPGNEQNTVTVNAVPVPPHNLAGLNLYRTKLGDPLFYLLTSFTRADLIAGISYTDNTADAGLGVVFPGSPPALVSVDLATDVHGRNISGLVENAGVNANGLSLDPYGPYTLVAGPGIAILPPLPPNAPVVVTGAAGGSVDVGSHAWAVSYTLTDGTAIIETNPSTRTSLTIANPNNQANVTADAPPGGNIGGFTYRSTKLYRTIVGGTTLLLVTESMGLGALSYTDAVGDVGLGAAAPALKQSKVQVDLARDIGGANISNLVEDAGTDTNGLQASGGGGALTPFTEVIPSGPAQSVAGAVLQDVVWGTISDSQGATVWTAGVPTKLIAPEDGYYQVHCEIGMAATFTGSAGDYQLVLDVAAGGDSSSRSTSGEIGNSTNVVKIIAGTSFIAHMTMGDYALAQVTFNSAGGVSLTTAVLINDNCNFSLIKIA